MADAVLDKLAADGKLPDQLGAKPDMELAQEWVREHGGRVDFYGLTGATGSLVAERAGHFTCARPSVNYAGRKYYDVPKVHTLDDEKRQAAYEDSLNPKAAVQPNWDWGKPDGVNDIIVHVPPKPPMTHSQNVYIEDQAEIDKRLDLSNGWVPNPQDLNPPPPAYLTPKPAAPVTTPAVDDPMGNRPLVHDRNPYTGEWVVESNSGLTAASVISRDDAIYRWNKLVENHKKMIDDAVAAAATTKP